MDHPQNDHDEDGGTFKLKPGAGQSQPQAPDEGGLDSTMKLRPVGGATPPGVPSAPPPPPSPLGGPTGPANPSGPPQTQVFPPSGAPQTQTPGFPGSQPGHPSPHPQSQQYGQTPPPGQYPPPQNMPQQGMPQGGQAPAPQGAVPSGIKKIGLMALIAGGVSLINVIVNIAFAGAETGILAVPGLLFALAVLGYGFALPRGMLASKGLRLTGIILMMVQGGFGLIGLLGLLGIMSLISGGVLALALLFGLVIVIADGWAAFIYFKDKEAHAWIGATQAGPQHTAPGQYGAPGQHGMQQQGGYPQQPGQPGGYPPPHGNPPGQHPPQPPYGR